MTARISKYELFLPMGDVVIKDVTAKKWETQMRVWHHGKKRKQVPHFGLCCVQLDSLLKHYIRLHSGNTEFMGGQVRKTSLARLSAHHLPGARHVNGYQQHNASLIKLKIKQERANRKQNNQAQSGIQRNTWEKLQKKNWSIYEAAETGNKRKWRHPKEKWDSSCRCDNWVPTFLR